VVLRAEPRMMMTRQRQLKNDLFLGLLVDCSGSMTEENRIERAKCFGAVLAEATRGLPGIELRVFGFNDETIFEVGDAERCAVAGLTADTQRGNNDAAALWHAAQVALASHRSSRLLVAISDGMPTACSTNALKALVTRLTKRMRILCAQVAVKPLEEICFPHYVALEADNTDEAVRKFGLIINRLIRKTMKA
jgi:cobalamin biosynthesis protein CobT